MIVWRLPRQGSPSGASRPSAGRAPPVIRKRDSAWRKDLCDQGGEGEEGVEEEEGVEGGEGGLLLRRYALRMSKSSDSITAAKLLAEAR